MRHEPVLVALRQLSGRDFGYDVEAWRKWWDAEGRRQFGDPEDFSAVEKRAVKQAGRADREATTPSGPSRKN
jgi:hypothetical protein